MPSLSRQHPVSEAVARQWLLDDLHTALTSSAPVLVSGQGQADVGRLVARALHERRRAARVTPFIEIPHDELPERLAALSTERGHVADGTPVPRKTCTVFVDDVDRLTPPRAGDAAVTSSTSSRRPRTTRRRRAGAPYG